MRSRIWRSASLSATSAGVNLSKSLLAKTVSLSAAPLEFLLSSPTFSYDRVLPRPSISLPVPTLRITNFLAVAVLSCARRWVHQLATTKTLLLRFSPSMHLRNGLTL